MKRLLSIQKSAAAFLLVPVVGALLLAAEAEPVSTNVPAGNFQTAWLRLAGGAPDFSQKTKAAIDFPLFLGFRDRKAVVAWFAHPALAGQRIVWLDSSSLTLGGGELAGQLVGRTNLNWGDKNVHDYQYNLNASVNQQQNVTGNFTVKFVDDAGVRSELSGTFSGELTTADQLASQQLAANANWPHYYGDGFQFAAPASGEKLVANWSQARPVWKSEAFIPTAYGSAPDSRYFDRAGRTDAGGGASSPVVANGRVYQFYYYPRGPVGRDKAYGKYKTEQDLIAIAKGLFPQREIQQQAVVNHFRMQADELLVCLDAATGQTLWKTTFPQRGNNYQTHKHRGHFPVPLVSGGVVYQPGTTGRLYAVDAASGKLHWEYPNAHPDAQVSTDKGIDCHAPSPVLVDGIVAFAAGNGVTGIDAKKGQKRWEQPLWHRSSLLAWSGGGKSFLIASDRKHESKANYAIALVPATGEIVWRVEVPYLMDYAFPILSGDKLLGYSLTLEGVKPGENDGLAVIHALQITETGLKSAWTAPLQAPIIDTVGLAADGEHIYVSAARQTVCLNLTNGQRVAAVDNVGGARTQTAFIGGGRLFIQPEGRHGRQSFFMLDADPKGFRIRETGMGSGPSNVGHPVGAEQQWTPPHSWTTAYANQPIVYPLVDGRLFVRGLDGLYCYDLRAR